MTFIVLHYETYSRLFYLDVVSYNCSKLEIPHSIRGLYQFFSFVSGNCWYGVDVMQENIADNFEACVWEPSIIRINALTAACEAACMILSVDETIKSPKSEAPPQAGGMPGRGMGRPMMG